MIIAGTKITDTTPNLLKLFKNVTGHIFETQSSRGTVFKQQPLKT